MAAAQAMLRAASVVLLCWRTVPTGATYILESGRCYAWDQASSVTMCDNGRTSGCQYAWSRGGQSPDECRSYCRSGSGSLSAFAAEITASGGCECLVYHSSGVYKLGSCKRPTGESVSFGDVDQDSMVNQGGNCDGSDADDDDDEDNSDVDSLVVTLCVVGALLVVIVIAVVARMKRRKPTKPPPAAASPVHKPMAPPPSPAPIKAEALVAEEAPVAEDRAAEAMAKDSPPPSEGWATRSLQRLASWRPSPRQREDSPQGIAGESAETTAEATSEVAAVPHGHVSGAEAAAMMAEGEPPPQPSGGWGRRFASWRAVAEPPPPPEAEFEPEC